MKYLLWELWSLCYSLARCWEAALHSAMLQVLEMPKKSSMRCLLIGKCLSCRLKWSAERNWFRVLKHKLKFIRLLWRERIVTNQIPPCINQTANCWVQLSLNQIFPALNCSCQFFNWIYWLWNLSPGKSHPYSIPNIQWLFTNLWTHK